MRDRTSALRHRSGSSGAGVSALATRARLVLARYAPDLHGDDTAGRSWARLGTDEVATADAA